MATYAVTGASDGLGLEIVRQLVSRPLSQVEQVIAITTFNHCRQLDEVIVRHRGRITRIAIDDITDEGSVRSALPELVRALPGRSLGFLINIAGMSDQYSQSSTSMPVDTITSVLRANVGSVQAVTAGLMPLLRRGSRKTVLNISNNPDSQGMGEELAVPPNFGYRICEAALNVLTRQHAQAYAGLGVTCFLISTDWHEAPLGSQSTDLTMQRGVAAILAELDRANRSFNGQFLNVKVDTFEADDGLRLYDGAGPW